MVNLQISKFHPPALPHGIIQRPELVKKALALSKQGMLFIHGPAGYGKTTLALLLMENINSRCAWLFLDSCDATAEGFFQSLIASLSAFQGNNDLIAQLDGNISFNSDPLKYSCGLLSAIDDSQMPDALVLDNLNMSTHIEIIKMLPYIKKYLPGETRLIVISRNPPQPEAFSLSVENVICTIDSGDLRFSREEIGRFLSAANMPLSGFSLDRIEKTTGGWAALVAAYALYGSRGSSHYFLSQLGDMWSGAGREALIKSAAADIIYPGFCQVLTGDAKAFSLIRRLYEETGFLTGYKNHAYIYNPVFKRFLQKEFDSLPDKSELYSRAFHWSLMAKKPAEALVMAVKSGDLNLVENALWAICRNKENISVDEVTLLIRGVDRNPEMLKENSCLAANVCLSLYLSGDFKGVGAYIDYGISLLKNEEMPPSAVAAAIFIQTLVKSPMEATEIFENPPRLFESSDLPIISITFHLPLFHKAAIDYTGIPIFTAKDADGLISKRLYGELACIMEKLIFCGILYERNDLAAAHLVAQSIRPLLENAPAEILLCHEALTAEIFFWRGKDKLALQALARTYKMAASKNASCLITNINALKTRLLLRNGDIDGAKEWLAKYPADVDGDLKLHHIYRHLTSVRALAATGEIESSVKLLGRLLVFSKKHKRTADVLEILTLRAVCLWRMKKKAEAAADLEAAIMYAPDLGLVTPIISEGCDVLPLLEYLINRLRLKLCSKGINKEQLMRLYRLSSGTAKISKGLFFNVDKEYVSLSPKQSKILELLARNMSYEEIAREQGVKISTVRDHISRLYDKLEVSNSKDAVAKGHELGLL